MRSVPQIEKIFNDDSLLEYCNLKLKSQNGIREIKIATLENWYNANFFFI